MAIEYTSAVPSAAEVHGSYSEIIAVEGNISQQVSIRVPWGERYLAALDIVGNGRYWPQNNIRTMANKCVIRPELGKYTQDGQAIAYEFAIIQVTYDFLQQGRKDKTTDPNTGNEILYTETIEPTWFAAQFKKDNMRWGSANGNRVDEAQDKRWQRMKFVRTMYGLSVVPQFFSLIGKTNDTAYSSSILGLTFDPETLLFIPPRISRTVTAEGTKGWTIQTGYDFNEAGWNTFWNSDAQAFQQIWNVKTNKRYFPYPKTSFTTQGSAYLWEDKDIDRLRAEGKLPPPKKLDLKAWTQLAGITLIDETK